MQYEDELEKETNEEKVKVSALTRYKLKFISLFKSNFFPDGYDEVKGKYTYPNIPTEIKNDTSEFWMYFVAFLGLPSRPKAFLNRERKVVHQLTLGQFLKNLIGGLDFAKDTSSTKKYLQLIGIFPIPIKIGVILLFKLATFPFKFLLNIVKLMLLVLVPILIDILFEILDLVVAGFNALAEILPSPLHYIPSLISWIIFIVALAAAIVLLSANFGLSIVAGIALAPLSWTRTVYNYISSGSTLAAVIFALFPLALAATIWAIAIPFVITGVLALFPSLMGAVTFVAHIPVIASVLTAYTGTFLAVSASVGTLFLPYSTALTGLFGITLSTAVVSIASASTIGLMAALIAVPTCYIADKLSDRWADWHYGGLLFAIIFGSKSRTTKYSSDFSGTEDVELVRKGSKKTQEWEKIPDPSESKKAAELKRNQQRGFGIANAADASASNKGERFKTGDSKAGVKSENIFVREDGTTCQRVEVLDDKTDSAGKFNDFN